MSPSNIYQVIGGVTIPRLVFLLSFSYLVTWPSDYLSLSFAAKDTSCFPCTVALILTHV